MQMLRDRESKKVSVLQRRRVGANTSSADPELAKLDKETDICSRVNLSPIILELLLNYLRSHHTLRLVVKYLGFPSFLFSRNL
jgi:hypothetical protein